MSGSTYKLLTRKKLNASIEIRAFILRTASLRKRGRKIATIAFRRPPANKATKSRDFVSREESASAVIESSNLSTMIDGVVVIGRRSSSAHRGMPSNLMSVFSEIRGNVLYWDDCVCVDIFHTVVVAWSENVHDLLY